MRNTKRIYRFILIILTLSFFTYEYAFPQVSVSNQLEYSNWKEYNRNVLENWTDISFQQDKYSFGLRYEINQPPDPFIFEFDTLLKQEELTYRYAEIYQENLTLTVGNFYALFGRGLTLRTYEDRNLRVDNNIDGLKANYYTDLFEITALGGRMRDKYNRRKDRLYGIDTDINVAEDLKIGVSILRNQLTDNNFTDLRSLRTSYIYNNFDFYGEVVNKAGEDEISGYGSLSYTGDYFTILGEYKDYDKLTFANNFGTEYNAPPSLTREHIYTLLNRHPHQLNTNNEVGYQLELTTDIIDNFEILLNSSQTYQVYKNNFINRFKTFLGLEDSKMKLNAFEEYYAQVSYHPNEDWHFETALGWNADHTTNTENITPLIMGEYKWDDINEIHMELQHQHVKNTYDKSEFDDELIVLEYTRSPFLNLTFVGEYSNKSELVTATEDKSYWIYGQVTLSFLESQQISLLYGSRQAGFVCVGGVCRFEPEFDGLEIKLLSRF
jgi:uncharacterized protein DUF6029